MSEQESIFSANFPTAATHNEPSEEDLAMFEGTTDIRRDFANDSDFKSNFSNIASQSMAVSEKSTSMPPPTLSHNILKTEDPIIGNNKALLVTDNDPFSPRMKKFDPFDDDFSKSPLDPFEFSFAAKNATAAKSTILPDTKIALDDTTTSGGGKIHIDKKITEFNGPLQVNLPPESYSAYMSGQQKRVERHNSDASDSGGSMSRTRPSVFKQNTVDTVISSISTKKMKPHMFSQKYSKRDSNSINMRRLQESDSLSENETAPEPPPRPDSSSHIQPPPLPPKKQFSDIVIRPRVTSPLATVRDSTARYDYIGGGSTGSGNNKQSTDATSPALPLPSRKVSRSDSQFPGPSRPAKKSGLTEDDYLTPISSGGKSDMPILLPPPQTKGTLKSRGRRQAEPVTAVSTTTIVSSGADSKDIDISLPDLTLSQLLTLGIDELASKLKVPVNKLSTMNIVELTQYLCDFIERSSQKSLPATVAIQPTSNAEPTPQEAIFKVSFDESNDATFIAKFDDSFGEDDPNQSFVPDFESFNAQPEATACPPITTATAKPSADRYAVFREIMDQELRSDDDQPNDANSSFGSGDEPNSDNDSNCNDDNAAIAAAAASLAIPAPPAIVKIDTKITQVIAQAKDRYAALRDIILVEDLFEKPLSIVEADVDLLIDDQTVPAGVDANVVDLFAATVNGDSDMAKDVEDDYQSSPEINISIMNVETDSRPLSCDKIESGTVLIVGSAKDDLEIDEYMNRAISNLSLDSRDHLSPISSKSPVVTGIKSQNASTSPIRLQSHNRLTADSFEDVSGAAAAQKSNKMFALNDMSTSPTIPLSGKVSPARSPIPLLSKSPISGTVVSKSPQPSVGSMIAAQSHNRLNSDSLSDVVCGSSPEVVKNICKHWLGYVC